MLPPRPSLELAKDLHKTGCELFPRAIQPNRNAGNGKEIAALNLLFVETDARVDPAGVDRDVLPACLRASCRLEPVPRDHIDSHFLPHLADRARAVTLAPTQMSRRRRIVQPRTLVFSRRSPL